MSKKKPKPQKKKPVSKRHPGPNHLVRVQRKASPDARLDRKPIWRTGMIDWDGQWGWANADPLGTIKDVFAKLASFETMTWSSIFSATHGTSKRRRCHHHIEVARLSAPAQRRLAELKIEDRDELFVFRISSRKRIWGIRDSEEFHVLWWDPDHTVYPVGER